MSGILIKKWIGEKSTNTNVRNILNIDEINDPFARQKLMSWWDQEKIADAVIIVFGAGAIGNETIKNLALLGFRRFLIIDMDHIEKSNLSRTVLFRTTDEGRKKSEVAAERAREMSLAEDTQIDWLCGDIMYEIGSGIFRHCDIVLGCLDNDATRFYIDRHCTMFEKPWINAGISELSVSVQLLYHKESGTCFHCGESPEVIARVMSRKASCGKTAIKDLNEGKIPTIQVASAIVAGIQTQEAAKYICGKPVDWGKNIYYQGTNHSFMVSVTRPDENCFHNEFGIARDVVELYDITQNSTMRELLTEAKDKLGITGNITIDLSDEQGRDFIRTAYCIYCGEEVPVNVPRYKFRDEMAVCESCKTKDNHGDASEPISNSVRYYNEETENEVLDLTLKQIGIPPLHVLRVYDENENEYFVETTGDLSIVMPNIFGKKEG